MNGLIHFENVALQNSRRQRIRVNGRLGSRLVDRMRHLFSSIVVELNRYKDKLYPTFITFFRYI